jgi:signal transduction histidine kinase
MRQLVDQRTRELKIANAELVELNVEKNNLISIVAHDLKSPLKQILGLLSVMKLTTRLDADHLEYIGIIEGSASRLDGMISKILDIEALESARLNVQMEQVDLSEKLSQVLSRFEHTAAAKQIQIEKQIAPGVTVRCDISFVDQVFDNLVSNAIKFSPFNKKIFVKLNVVKGKALVEIKDQGPGLTEDDKKNLFGKFQKLSARPTGDEVSTGLGLSIVRKYVEAMQGELWCESVFGSGASFFVAFGEQKGK